MDTNKKIQVLSPDEIVKNWWRGISKNAKIGFFAGMLSFLLFHMFAFTNALFVHDGMLIYNDSEGIVNGRFLVSLFMPLFNRMTLPWMMGLIASIFVGLSVVYLTKVCNINKTLGIVMTALFISSFPVMVANNLYISSCYIYTFALFISVLSVYYADKNIWVSGLLLIVSLACYQAYLGVTSTLLIIKLICDMRDEKISGKKVPLRALKYLLILVISLGLYYGIWKVLMAITNTPIANYRGYTNLIGSMTGDIIGNMGTAYASSFIGLFFNHFELALIPSACFTAINTLAFVLTDVNMGKKNKNRIWLTLCFIVLPLSTTIIYMISPAILHLLMLFPYALPAILFISNIENMKVKSVSIHNLLKWVSVILVGVTVFSFVAMGNANYVKAKTQYDNSISYCTRFLDRIEQMEGVTKDTKIVIVADDIVYGIYDEEEWSYGRKFFVPCDGNGAITYPETLGWFLEQEMNTRLNISVDEKNEYANLESVKALTAFPSTNCFVWVGDVLVFKMM